MKCTFHPAKHYERLRTILNNSVDLVKSVPLSAFKQRLRPTPPKTSLRNSDIFVFSTVTRVNSEFSIRCQTQVFYDYLFGCLTTKPQETSGTSRRRRRRRRRVELSSSRRLTFFIATAFPSFKLLQLWEQTVQELNRSGQR